MQKKIEDLKNEALKTIQNSKTNEDLNQIEITFLGRKSQLTQFSRQISSLPKEERPLIGKNINQAKVAIENELELKKAEIEKNKMNNLQKDEWIDVTMSLANETQGHRHPLSVFIENIVDTFCRLGFSQANGPEMESEWYNFTALNLNPDHPAREMQDTFFIENLKSKKQDFITDERDLGMVLRTQTSSMQIRYMQQNQPPIRIFAP